MSGLDVVIADYDRIKFQVIGNPCIEMRNTRLDVVEIVGCVVALEVVSVVNQYELGIGLAHLVDIGRNVGDGCLVFPTGVAFAEIAAVNVGHGVYVQLIFSVLMLAGAGQCEYGHHRNEYFPYHSSILNMSLSFQMGNPSR